MLGETAPDYLELNAEVSKNPSKRLSAPALVRHLGFWTNINSARSIGIAELADNLIRTLCTAIQNKGALVNLEPNVSGLGLLFNSVCHPETFCPRSTKNLTKLQSDIFESTGREVSFRFIWEGLDVTTRFEIHTEYLSISTFIELRRDFAPYSKWGTLNWKIDKLLQYLSSNGETVDHESLTKDLNEFFFAGFWTEYENDIFSDPQLSKIKKDELFENIFADFRGLILSERAKKFSGGSDWGRQAKEKLLPLIHHKGSNEYTANYVLNRKGFYLSALGSHSRLLSASKRPPVEFIVYVKHADTRGGTAVNRRQLARLINQIILLGTLRLAALKYNRLLRKIGGQLSLLERYTQEAREAIASSDEERTDDSQPDALKLIKRAQDYFNDITGPFLRTTGNGLLYRIERSRYYVSQFRAGTKLLRIDRLEGDQPYDEFVNRQLRGQFDFINRLGIRLGRATRNIINLDQNYLTIKTNKIDKDIQHIQAWGEMALFGALVPYYVMHLLDLFIEEPIIPRMTILVWTGFGSFAVIRKCWPALHLAKQLLYPVPLAAIVGLALPYILQTGTAQFLGFREPESLQVRKARETEVKDAQARLEGIRTEELKTLKDLLDSQRQMLEFLKGESQIPQPSTPSPKS